MNVLELEFPDINPVAIEIFGLKIHWYAIMYLLSFIAGYYLVRRRLQHEPFRSVTKPAPYTKDVVPDLLIYAILGVILGGRLGYVLFYQPLYYLEHPLEIFALWNGGMSFHGGALGVIIGLFAFARVQHRPFLQLTDLLVPAVPLGLAFGRFGNFINGELWGRQAPADLPWAMVFPGAGAEPRHPSQLYELLLEGLTLFVVIWLFARKPRYRGEVSALFLIGYGVFRFIVEYYREPDAFLGLLSLGWSMGQWLSAPMILAGIAIWFWARQHRLDAPADLHDSADEAELTDEQEAEKADEGESKLTDDAEAAVENHD